ncbi:MAG: hypothetical protein IJU40_00680, partial [Desulfovibrionaceae bacterium]|nr:hypothetical protein [Desulfovibrionaceae bacterium]
TLPNDYVFKEAYAHKNTHRQPASPNEYENLLGFDPKTHQNSYLNSGPTYYNSYGTLLNYTSYNGMIIGYTGDSDQFDSKRNNGIAEKWIDYEILTISEAKEDLILWYPGNVSGAFKVYVNATLPDISSIEKDTSSPDPLLYLPPIDTQELAQAALNSLDKAIVKKDKIRANLGALQNRFENTITNLTTQAENLLASESRISDVDIATEMTNFVRNQILTQSAVAMLSQANTVPQMALQIIGS